MAVLERTIFPVGMGGFALECLDDFKVIYDCGSNVSVPRVEFFINKMEKHCGPNNIINYLFISHFDEDHVNCIEYLLKHFRVKYAVIPAIRSEFRLLYNVATNFTYQTLINMLIERDTTILPNQENGNYDSYATGYHQVVNDPNSVWEWIGMTMLTNDDYLKILENLARNGVDINRLNEADYLNSERKNINKVFKDTFGPCGPNAKGLAMLSQPKYGNEIIGIRPFCYLPIEIKNCTLEHASCLYTGDIDLKSARGFKKLYDFYTRNKTEDKLLIMQIPHHGSQYNSDNKLTQFSPELFYYTDNNSKRMDKNKLSKKLIPIPILRSGDMDGEILSFSVLL